MKKLQSEFTVNLPCSIGDIVYLSDLEPWEVTGYRITRNDGNGLVFLERNGKISASTIRKIHNFWSQNVYRSKEEAYEGNRKVGDKDDCE